MGGGQQQNPSIEQLIAQQQRQEIGKAFESGFQRIGANLAQPIASPSLGGGGSYQQASPLYQGGALPAYQSGVTGPLFRGGSGQVNEQQLAQILAALGYV